MKSKNSSYYKKKCDILFSKLVRKKGYCQRCGKTDNLQCAHIISRKYLVLRWDFKNALCLCYRCHIFFAHREPVEFTLWIIEKWGQGLIDYLLETKQKIRKFTLDDYREMFINFTNQLK